MHSSFVFLSQRPSDDFSLAARSTVSAAEGSVNPRPPRLEAVQPRPTRLGPVLAKHLTSTLGFADQQLLPPLLQFATAETREAITLVPGFVPQLLGVIHAAIATMLQPVDPKPMLVPMLTMTN